MSNEKGVAINAYHIKDNMASVKWVTSKGYSELEIVQVRKLSQKWFV